MDIYWQYFAFDNEVEFTAANVPEQSV